MRLLGRHERGIDAEMKRDRSVPKPGTAATREFFGLGDLLEAEQIEIERAGGVFAARRDRELYVVEF